MHVVLKTRHANPNIHVRRFIVHVRSPNSFVTRPQLLSLRGAATYYGLAPHTATRLHLLPRHSRVKTQASKLEEGYYSLPSLPRKVASLSEEEEKGKPRKGISTYIGRRADLYWSTHRPILVTTATNIGSYHPSIETPRRSRTERAHTLTAKRDTQSYVASPRKDKSQAPALLRELALGGIWMERSYSPLPVEVVDADLTARTYAVGRTRRADT